MHDQPSPRRPRTAPRRRRALVAALLALVVAMLLTPLGAGLLARAIAAQRPGGAAAFLVNPCNGELIALRETSHLLPHVTSAQSGSREAGVSAVGLSGVGSTGTYYLPMGTGKVVLTLDRGSIGLAVGGDLELVARAAQSPDFRLHGIGRLKLSAADGFGGSGLTLQSRCGP